MNTKKCKDEHCDNRIELQPWPGAPRTRQRYCDPCRTRRVNESTARSRDNRAKGIPPRPMRSLGQRREDAMLWVCHWLWAHPCACGQANILALRFVPLVAHTGPTVFDLAAQGTVTDDELKAAAAACVVMCESCHAINTGAAGGGFRRRFIVDVEAGLLDPTAGVTAMRAAAAKLTPYTRAIARRKVSMPLPPGLTQAQPPRRPVPPLVPQAREFGGAPGVEGEIPRPRPADLPSSEVGGQATPEQPAGDRPQEDVRDVPAAVALGQPVAEAPGGGGVNNTVDAGGEGRVRARLINPGVVIGGRFVRPQRQR